MSYNTMLEKLEVTVFNDQEDIFTKAYESCFEAMENEEDENVDEPVMIITNGFLSWAMGGDESRLYNTERIFSIREIEDALN